MQTFTDEEIYAFFNFIDAECRRRSEQYRKAAAVKLPYDMAREYAHGAKGFFISGANQQKMAEVEKAETTA